MVPVRREGSGRWRIRVTALVSPLPPRYGARFSLTVAERIAGCSSQARGPGLVYRVAVEAQRDFLKLDKVAVGRSHPVRQLLTGPNGAGFHVQPPVVAQEVCVAQRKGLVVDE